LSMGSLILSCAEPAPEPIGSIAAPIPAASCGDGFLDPGEACDDDNNNPLDGCSIICTVELGATCQPNRVANPFFTGGAASWNDDSGAAPEVNNEEVYGGSGIGNPVTELDNAGDGQGQIAQTMNLVPGQSLRLSFWA